MKKTILILFTIFLPFHLLFAVDFTVAYGPDEHFPFVFGNSEKVPETKRGIAVDMIQTAAEMVEGVEIKFVRLPVKRTHLYLKLNRVDALFGASYKTSRLAMGWYPTTNRKHDGPPDPSRRLSTYSYSLYKLEGSQVDWDGKNFLNLKQNMRFGASVATSIVGDMRKKGLNINECRNWRCNVDMLRLKRVSGVFLLNVTADYLLELKRLKGIVKVNPPIIAKHYYLMISDGFVKKHPEHAQKIWDALGLVRETKLTAISDKYYTE